MDASERISSRAQLPEELELEDISKYFVLSRADHAQILECRGTVNKLGFSIQLCSLRWFGYLLPDMRNVPLPVVERLMQQLEMSGPVDLSEYLQSENTRIGHQERIREYLGYQIGRVDKTKLILRCLHDEAFRKLQTKELNKGERSHDLDRFLFFGKQGTLRSRDFLDQTHSFSCLAILHNAVVVWNLTQLPAVLERLKARGHVITDEDLALVSPLLWKHVNPLGHYDITSDRWTAAQ